MRHLSVLWANDRGRYIAEQLEASFTQVIGAPTRTERSEFFMSLAFYRKAASNIGFAQSEGSTILLPYRMHTDDGHHHDVSSPVTIAAIDGFMDDRSGPNIAAPFSALRMSNDALELGQDFIGSGRCFVYHSPDVVVVTNCLVAAADVIGTDLDETALASFATCGWVRGSHTFHRAFSLPEPNSRLSFTRVNGEVKRQESIARNPSIGDYRQVSIETIGKSLAGLASSIASAADGEIALGLSGGRDSRLMAAIFLQTSGNIKFFTTNNYDGETAIARRLMVLAGREDGFTVNAPSNTSSKGPGSFVESARALVRAHDGLQEPTYVGMRIPSISTPFAKSVGIQISGAAGEMAHGHYYPKLPIELSTSAALEHLLKRITGLNTATKASKEFFRSETEKLFATSPPYISGTRVLDYFYLYERQRRWSSFSAEANIAAPMASPTFAFGSFSFDEAAIRSNSVHRQITEQLMPAWKGIEYFKAPMGAPINRKSISKSECEDMLQYIKSFDRLKEVLDMDRVESVVRDWHFTRAPTRDAVLKRATWLAAAVEQFG